MSTCQQRRALRTATFLMSLNPFYALELATRCPIVLVAEQHIANTWRSRLAKRTLSAKEGRHTSNEPQVIDCDGDLEQLRQARMAALRS